MQARSRRLLPAIAVVAVMLPAATVARAEEGLEFVASKTGSVSSAALSTQTFTLSAGTIECSTATGSAEASERYLTSLTLKVSYGECAAFGSSFVTISEAEVLLSSADEASLLNTMVVNVESLLGNCTVEFGPQSLAAPTYVNASGHIEYELAGEDLEYTSSGGVCGSSGTNATLKGSDELSLAEGTIEVAFAAFTAVSNPGAVPVGPGKPFKFAAGEKTRTLVLTNPGALRHIFLNETGPGVPGVLTLNENGNFTLKAVPAKECAGGLGGKESCEILVDSAAAGWKGKYELQYGNAANKLVLSFVIES